ncbi:MAG: glycosyltransferase family 2 protein [Dehalococcoidia bacterium]|nr:glycosyltransferase family 2 protein [Dehalococcoidia bacterium]
MTSAPTPTTVDIILPVYNEVAVLRQSVEKVLAFVAGHDKYAWHITIADNGSTDGTGPLARELEAEHPGKVEALLLTIKGRGLALKEAWTRSHADIVCYMDIDLSTDLAHLPQLVDRIAERGCDVAIGTRLAKGSKTRRSLKREITSRGYVFLIRATFPKMKISDAQCGFKALSRKAADDIVPRVENGMWFFDTELLILAHRLGYKICEVPVRWDEDPDTKVHIIKTAIEDIKGLARMRRAKL